MELPFEEFGLHHDFLWHLHGNLHTHMHFLHFGFIRMALDRERLGTSRLAF